MDGGILAWRDGRYLKLALLLTAAGVALYLSQTGDAAQPPNGGTWQGYILGGAGAALVVWLSVLGIRKRRYRSTAGTLQGWTSAHVYLGLALLAIATLHCAAQFGWNIHTLAYALMCAVIASGIYGLYAYVHYPAQLVANSGGRGREECLQELAQLDQRALALAGGADADVHGLVASAIELTRLGGGAWQQLAGRDRSRVALPPPRGSGRIVANADQAVVIAELAARIPDASKQAEAQVLNDLLGVCGRRRQLLQQLRRDIRLRGWLKAWLYLHVPLTAALLAAVLGHVLAVFFYW